MTDGSERAERNFYGRRKAKTLHGRKVRLLEELLPERALPLECDAPSDLGSLFPGMPETINVEIGFGGGEHLAHRAASEPSVGFIGVEPFIDGMAKMLGRIDDDGLANIRLHNDDAAPLLDWLPAGSVSRIDLLYPDPWPKTRHWKRRFVNQANLERIFRALTTGGVFHFASDIDTCVNWTLAHVHDHGKFRWTAERAADWNEPWDGWFRTRYEAKAIREGRSPCYLTFQKP